MESSHNDEKVFAVYVMANSIKTFFVGITDNLMHCVQSHKENSDPHSFTSRYDLHDLVYYELYTTQNSARNREVKLRSLKKAEMLELMTKMNPDGTDIFDRFLKGETPQVLEKERIVKKRKYKRKPTYTTTVYSLRSIHSGDD